MKNSSRFPINAAVAAVSFAATVVMTKVALDNDQVNSIHFAASVALFAGLGGLIFLWPERKGIKSFYQQEWRLILFVSALAAGGAAFLRVGQRFTTAGNAGLISSLTSVTTIIFAYFILREKLSRKILALLPVLFAFLAALVLDFDDLTINKGDLLIIAMVIVIGLANVISTILVRRNPSTIVGYNRLVLGALLYSPLLFLESEFSIWALPVGLLTLTFIYFFYRALQINGPQISTIIFSIYPPMIFIYSWIFLDESLSARQIISASGVLLIAAYIGLQRNQIKG